MRNHKKLAYNKRRGGSNTFSRFPELQAITPVATAARQCETAGQAGPCEGEGPGCQTQLAARKCMAALPAPAANAAQPPCHQAVHGGVKPSVLLSLFWREGPGGSPTNTLYPTTAQLAGTEDQQSRPPPPPRQGLDPAGRLGHAGAQTSVGTHGRRSGGADGLCRRPMLRRRSNAAAASRRP